MRERPREAASKPAASGERSRRPVSAARTIVARRCRGSIESPNCWTITSKVHSSPRWLQNTFSTSNGVASNRSATAWTSAAATNRKTAPGSMNRRISHGHAIRSIFGRDRVTQTVRPRPSRFGILPAGHGRKLGLLPTNVTAFEDFRRDLVVAQPGGGTLAQFLAFLADHHDGLAGQPRSPFLDLRVRPPRRTRDQAGVGPEIFIDADVDQRRRVGGANEPGQFFGGNGGVGRHVC